MPARQCEPPPERKTNIKIEKVAGHCVAGGTPGATVAAIQPSVICNFGIKVSNTGPGNFNGVVGFLDAAQYGVAAISPLAAPG